MWRIVRNSTGLLLLTLLLSVHLTLLDAAEEDDDLHPEDKAKILQALTNEASTDATKGGPSPETSTPICLSADIPCVKQSVLDLLKALENCQRDRIPIALDNIRELEGRVQARTDEGASIESRMNAQILNLKAQNQKLVAELTRYQGLGVDNEGLRVRMRNMSTNHNVVEREILKATSEVQRLEEMVKDMRHKDVKREEACEDNIAALREAYFKLGLHVPAVGAEL